eukprot:gene5589-7229_t
MTGKKQRRQSAKSERNATSRIPIAGLSLMVVMGIVLVDMNFDAVLQSVPETTHRYYEVQQGIPPPASLIIPTIILVALLDVLYSMLFLRDWRELFFLSLGCYILYLFVGIIIPSLQLLSSGSYQDPIEYVPILETVRDAHRYMCPTLALLVCLNVYTHVMSPVSSPPSKSK